VPRAQSLVRTIMPLIKTRYGHKAVQYGSYSSCDVTPPWWCTWKWNK